MLTLLLLLGLIAICGILALLVAGAIAVSPLILLILVFPVLDVIVVGALFRRRKKKED